MSDNKYIVEDVPGGGGRAHDADAGRAGVCVDVADPLGNLDLEEGVEGVLTVVGDIRLYLKVLPAAHQVGGYPRQRFSHVGAFSFKSVFGILGIFYFLGGNEKVIHSTQKCSHSAKKVFLFIIIKKKNKEFIETVDYENMFVHTQFYKTFS